MPEPKTRIEITESGKVIDKETGELLDLEERVNTLGYYMNELAERKKQYEAETAELQQTVDKLKAGLKEDMIKRGEGLVYGRVGISVSRPMTTWDRKGLESYAEQHPEINEFRKTGNPIVSFRLLQDKD